MRLKFSMLGCHRTLHMKNILFLSAALLLSAALPTFAADKKIVLVAGTPSHGPGDHEFNAGVLLLKKCLDQVPGVKAVAHLNGWPKDANAFEGADAILLYMDGGGGHPAVQPEHLQQLGALMKKGVGLGCAHYAVEVQKDKGGPEFQNWIGGYYEGGYSCNPMWKPEYTQFPNHPIARGVQPFSVTDEWYMTMRFRPDMKGVTPILVAKPSDAVRKGPYVYPPGPYEHIIAASGRDETMMWAVQRDDGGRGFGFTGGHKHVNWGNENYRKVVLNALLWIAKVEVPVTGVASTISEADLAANLDPKGGNKPKPAAATSAAPVQPVNAKFRSGIVTSGAIKVDTDITGAKNLYLVVTDGGNGFACDWADWANAQLSRADGTTVKLTDLKWKSASAGWGEVRVDKNAGGQPLKINGKKYDNGIGTHSPSLIHFALPEGNFTRFTATAGLDNGGTDQGGGAQVEFLVCTEAPPAALLAVTGAAADAGVPQERSGSAAAKEYLKTMTVADGLEVTLFASEPMVKNPTDIDIDERGRVWVAEGVNYRSSFQKWGVLDPKGDRIVILHDTNGDGAADKETVFYQDPSINAALGVCVLGNKVIVASSPNVFVLTDTDGDGVADKRELLFTDIKGFDHDHAVHAFTFGPDGKLYFNFGNAGSQLRRPSEALKNIPLHGLIDKQEMQKGPFVVDLAGNEVTDQGKPYRQGMVFRCNLDGSEFETLAWNFRNNYEVAVDSFGTLWQSDNDDDGNKGVRINYVMEFGNFGYTDEVTGAGWGDGWKKAAAKGVSEAEKINYEWHLFDPGVVPNLLNTGAGSPTGIAVYEGKLLPKIFQGQVIHCDAGPRVVRAYPVKTDGAGYKAEVVDILTSSDSWYRPSDVCTGPDGALYIADWNDPGVGGHNMQDHELARMTGRIYRVAPPGFKSVVPKLDLKSAAGCVAALQSPNLSTRYLAWTGLNQMQGKAEKELLKVWTSAEPRQRARALQLLARIKGSEKKYVEAALKDQDADIRITGLRIARALKLDVVSYVKMLTKDSTAQLRRECAIALRHNESPEAPKLWAQLAQQHDGKDRWYLEALGIGADKQETKYFAAWLEAAGSNWNTAAGRDIIWRSRGANVPAYIVKIVTDKNTPEKEKERYLRTLDFIKGPEKDAALVEIATSSLK